MSVQTMLIAATILGALASIGSLAFACVQTIRLRDIRRRDEADLWEYVRAAHMMLERLEESKLTKENSLIDRVYSSGSDLHRGLIRHLALRERRFTQATIERWKAAHRLTNSYQESVAQSFIDIPKDAEPNKIIKLNIILTFLCILFVGCSNKPNETEFYALKEANESFESIRQKGYLDWKNILFKEKYDTQNATEEFKVILDGAIIKSKIGKDIRANIQKSLILFALLQEGGVQYAEKFKELSESAETQQDFQKQANVLMNKFQNDEKFKDLSERIESYKADRLIMLSKMRAKLEN